jgi:hypothetical protein
MFHFEDRAFSHASAPTSWIRGWFSVENPAILICMFVCVIVMLATLILAFEGLSKATDWYEPTLVNFVGP